MIQLAASILALGVGPILDKFSRPSGFLRAALDAFTFVAMLGLILGHIIPDAFALAGWPTLAIAGIAWFGPTFFETRILSLADRAHASALLLGAFGLVVHGTIDGMSLVTKSTAGGWSALAVAVILHRIPAGLTLWWLIRPKWGRFRAQLILGLLGVTTMAGYMGAEVLKGSVSAAQEGFFQALVGGALLHVVMHRTGHRDPDSAKLRQAGTFLGTALGCLLLSWMLKTGAHEHAGVAGTAHGHGGADTAGSFVEIFMELARESAPALVIAFTLAGLIQVFLPAKSVKWMSKGGPFQQSLRGVAFGLPLPICSCGVVPLYRSLASRGVPLGALMAFLVATPELGIDAVLLSLPLLGAEMATARVLAAAFVAIATAWLLARLNPNRTVVEKESANVDQVEMKPSFLDAVKIGWMKFFDTTAPWILLGLAIAAVCQPFLPAGAFDNIPSWLQVPLFAVIGMPLYVCASGATPMVAVLLLKGISPGAAIAFLLTGPATNVTTFGVLREIHGKKLAIGFVLAIILVTVTTGFVTNEILGSHSHLASHSVAPEPTGHGVDPLHNHDSSPTSVANICLWILGAGLLISLYRQGPQRFISHVFSQTDGTDDHHHGEEKDCCHEEKEAKPHDCCSS